MRGLCLALVAAIWAGTGVAADLAVVITNAKYRFVPSPELSNLDHTATVARLRAEGFEVIGGENLDRAGFRALAQQLAEKAPAADRLVLVYAGHAVIRADGTFLVPVGQKLDTELSVSFQSVPLTTFARLLAARPDRAALFLGTPADLPPPLDALSMPQPRIALTDGVMLARAPAARIGEVAAAMIRTPALVPQGVAISGTPTPVQALSPVPARPRLVSPGTGIDPVEEALWTLARTTRAPETLRAYLSRYPSGRYREQARALLDASGRLMSAEERGELALGLTALQRRSVQSDLAVLGQQPGAIDGVFGPATRAAIRRWQGASGLPATGYLAARQVPRLHDAADAQRSRDDRRQAAEDAAFWRVTGATGRRDDLQAYLDRYPRGIYADQAKRQLAALNTGRDGTGRTAEQRDWRNARERNTISAYRAFLAKHPTSNRADLARKRIERLRDAN